MLTEAQPKIVPTPIVDFGIIGRAWKSIWTYPIWVLGSVILFGVTVAFSYLGKDTFTPGVSSSTSVGFSYLAGFASSAVWTTLAATYQREYLRMQRGARPKLSGMLNTLHSEWALILLGVTLHAPTALLWFGARYVVPIPDDSAMGVVYTLALGALASLIVFPFQFAQLFIVDQGDSLFPALGKSFRFVAKAPFQLLRLMILTAFAGMLGAVACFVGVIFTLPVQLLSLPLIYEDNRQAGIL